MMPPSLPVAINDIVEMRKKHPCGGNRWQVVRVGADIGIRCQTCGRRVLLARSSFERQVRRLLERGHPPPTD